MRMSRDKSVLQNFARRHRDGACGGPLKRDILSIPNGDLSGKVL